MNNTNTSTEKRRPSLLMVVILVAQSLILSISPALAGKKKEKDTDPDKGGLYRPIGPVTKPQLIMDTSTPENNKLDPALFTVAPPAPVEPPAPLSRVHAIDSMKIRSLFE